jgi:cystathionine beta-synthase
MSAAIPSNVLEMIGNTPILELAGFDTGPCRLFLKLENQNPGGSIKDRMARAMVEAAEKEGKLKPGDTLVDATSGNTGIALAMVALIKGYKLKLVVPDKFSQEKIAHIRALGAEVIMTRSDVTKGHPAYYSDLSARIASETPNSYLTDQFANPANPRAHEIGTGPEIWEQMGHDIDAIVCGVGTSGTITGLSRYFAGVQPNLEMVLADPEGSVLAGYVKTGEIGKAGSWAVEGIGEDYIPSIADFSRVRAAYTISDCDAFETGRALARKTGILAGSSTGLLLAGALRYCREQKQTKKVLTFVCDSGNKYLSKMYSDAWMREQGFLDRAPNGDLTDLISRPHSEHTSITVGPDAPMLVAYNRMRSSEVSQLPVLENDRVIGIIDESDLLIYVHQHLERFRDPVSAAMIKGLDTLSPKASIDDLIAVFERDHVAIIVEDGAFVGLITRSDLLGYLRRKLK